MMLFLCQVKCAMASKLLTQLEEVGSVDPQVAVLLLRQCGGLVHVARSTPPSLVTEGFKYLDNDVRHCFALCTGEEIPPIVLRNRHSSV